MSLYGNTYRCIFLCPFVYLPTETVDCVMWVSGFPHAICMNESRRNLQPYCYKGPPIRLGDSQDLFHGRTTVKRVTVNNCICTTAKRRSQQNRDHKMAFCTVLILCVMYLTTINAQAFCDDVTNRGDTCFSAPPDCSNVGDCEMTMTAVNNTDTFTITLTGKSDGWIAIGFSGDQIMGQDDVIMCIYDGSAVELQHRYNEDNKKNNIQGKDLGADLVLLNQSYTQGIISCTFNRTKSVDGTTDAFGLVGSVYFGFFGRGPVNNGEPKIHDEFPWTSDTQIDLASGDRIEVSRRGGNPTPSARPSTPPGDTEGETTPPSVGVTSFANVTGTVILLLVCILFF
ncbi:Ferric-chelate reductase 1 [Holothuria leucospilota]|uniref:Ferric-chelate reductase 1 n=1 Tax=Holothuria leucospilota TaxID=206669 RepID=A0A9Q1BLJ8_HOLLE|nr:Ferric-chelate reductase 1 [Holothuria leucospilota]